MNLDKIGVALCFAMQEHEGPFWVETTHPQSKDWRWCSRSEVKQLSDDGTVISIDLSIPRKERRWIDRRSPDRRAK